MNGESIDKNLRDARSGNGPSPLQDPQINAVIDRVW
jgi:hypothetical protein